MGVALGFGGTTNGLSVSANANASSGKQKGNSLTHSNTTVDAGNTVTLVSDRDTALAGAQVKGSQVTSDVGRSLTIASQQDIDNYTSKQGSVSGGLSYTFGGCGPGGSFSFSRDKMDSKYRSVNDQSGLFAGAGGFDVTVGEHTQLDGAVLASTATADKNRLDTGTLGFGDIYNEADFRVQHQGGGFSTGGIGALIASNIGNVMLMGAGSNGHSDGTTQAAISQGTIVVRDQDRQKQDIADLSRDAQNANDSISKIFDKEKEQRRMEQAQLIGEISSQVGKIVSTYGEIAATESANEKMKGVQQEDRESARKAWEKLHPNKTATEQDVSQYLYDGFYNSALEKSEMGTGGSYQRAIQTTTAIVQGLSGGNINVALAGAAAPYLANQIARHIAKEDREARLIAHAVLGAALAAVQKQDIAAGAAGASIGELTGMIALQLKGVTAGELSEADKQTVSALATLASTLAGGLIGDSGATAVNAGLAGKNAVENNHLSPEHQKNRSAELVSCGNDTNCLSSVREHYAEEYERVQKKINTCSSAEDCISIAKELKQWKTENSARSDELTARIRDKGVDSLTKAEQLEWKNLRGAQSNFEGSINTLLYRAKMYGGSEDTTTELVNIFGHAAIANAAGVTGGVAKANGRGSQGSAIPVPYPQKASNGIVYQSNGKHTPGQNGYHRNAGTEPANSIQLFFGKSMENGKKRYALDEKGEVHQFTNTNDGTWHWSGSTGDASVPIKKSDIPNAVKKQFGLPGKWR